MGLGHESSEGRFNTSVHNPLPNRGSTVNRSMTHIQSLDHIKCLWFHTQCHQNTHPPSIWVNRAINRSAQWLRCLSAETRETTSLLSSQDSDSPDEIHSVICHAVGGFTKKGSNFAKLTQLMESWLECKANVGSNMRNCQGSARKRVICLESDRGVIIVHWIMSYCKMTCSARSVRWQGVSKKLQMWERSHIVHSSGDVGLFQYENLS